MIEKSTFESEEARLTNKPHNAGIIFTFLLNAVLLAGLLFLNYGAASLGITRSGVANSSRLYPIDVSPAGYTFSTWGVIFTLQVLWTLYSIASIFLKTKNGRLYQEPAVFTPSFFMFIFLHYGYLYGWLFVLDSNYITVALVFLAIPTICLYLAGVVSHKNIFDAQKKLQDNRVYLWLYRILVNNGIAFYAAWATLATFLSLAISWTYEWNGKRDVASISSLSLATLLVFAYFFLDVAVFEKYTRFTISPYLQLIWGYTGNFSKKF
ncbi:hypothetical protein BpHYR1_024554 [Brachionus plicatilis]|uniref:Uncharacterized protein n=1 Tax=Brachionus plicatilis TaxID=10195 RepID=A0A3M7P7R7_BRAPC|nr:hypothetical protein BpHYR1_024554 [Brachionus plicatilis]